MIIVSSFDLNYNDTSGFFTVIAKESAICPLCGDELSYRDSVFRMLQSFLGEIRCFLIRRLCCQNQKCKKLHRELPDIIQPYRHYESEAIQSVLDGNEAGCAADNSTICRWKTEFAKAESDISQRLASVYAQKTDDKVPIAATVSILDCIKANTKRWLAFVMVLLINSGHIIRTQFAFRPFSVADTFNSVSKNATEGGKKDDKTIKNTS